jgi:uncharacterized membrane protein
MAKAQSLATTFGALSAAIGIWYAVAPRHFLQTIGVRPNPRRIAITELVAAQEMSVASALMMDGRAGRWLASRVAGDVIHAGMLMAAVSAPDYDRRKAPLAFGALLAIGAADVAAMLAATSIEKTGVQLEKGPGESSPAALTLKDGAIHRAVTIRREPQEVYDFWRQLDNLPRFMKHLERVDVLDDKRSHWIARAPVVGAVEWDAEIVADEPGRRIAWQSTQNSQIWNSGEVTFERAPRDRGTEVRVRLEYSPPGGAFGVAVARLLGEEPANQTAGDLRRLKQVLEAGEVVVSDAVAEGRSRRQRPAQPIPVAA